MPSSQKEFEDQYPRVVFVDHVLPKAEREESEIIDEVDVAPTLMN